MRPHVLAVLALLIAPAIACVGGYQSEVDLAAGLPTPLTVWNDFCKWNFGCDSTARVRFSFKSNHSAVLLTTCPAINVTTNDLTLDIPVAETPAFCNQSADSNVTLVIHFEHYYSNCPFGCGSSLTCAEVMPIVVIPGLIAVCMLSCALGSYCARRYTNKHPRQSAAAVDGEEMDPVA